MQILEHLESYKKDAQANLVITLFSNFSRQTVRTKKIKMKFLIVFALCFVAALAAPADDVQVLRNEYDIGVEGYSFG